MQIGLLLALLETVVLVFAAYFLLGWWVLVPGGAIVCATIILSLRVDFVMSPHSVRVTNVLSRQQFAWSEVHAIIAKSVALTPSDERCLHLVLRDGRRVPIVVTFWPGRKRALSLARTIEHYCPPGVQLDYRPPKPGRDFGLRGTSSWQPPNPPD